MSDDVRENAEALLAAWDRAPACGPIPAGIIEAVIALRAALAVAPATGDAAAVRHDAAEVARRGAVVAYEQMADPRNGRTVAHTYADCMEAVGKALDECEAMIRALPLPAAAPAVEEAISDETARCAAVVQELAGAAERDGNDAVGMALRLAASRVRRTGKEHESARLVREAERAATSRSDDRPASGQGGV